MTATRMFSAPSAHLDEHADDSQKTGSPDSFAKFRTVAKRLESLFGTGDNAALRRKLYIRIQKCTIEHGPECYDVVRQCVASAQVADNPSRYFCVAVTAELRAQGYWAPPATF